MIYSRTGEQQKGQKIRVRRMSTETEQAAFEATRKQMKSYLQALNISPEQFEELSSIVSLKDMIQKFSQMLTQSLRSRHPSSGSVLDDNFYYYQRREVAFQEKISSLNEEVLKLMTALSLREQELAERESELFSWKLKVEEKQKTILLLASGKESLVKNTSSSKSEVKIKVNQPKADNVNHFDRQESSVIPLNDQKVGKKSRQYIRQQFPESWREERKHLLKMLREKDLKIYQLIQQLNKLQKSKN